ncbi:uncharacterized protein METZ01_LOCUS194760 [marine metagenome]|uniref:Uncharacterized protein n=1 Tax=marine metagenome TaxID=408172 RepID=A0A382DTS6_9ZZZZ
MTKTRRYLHSTKTEIDLIADVHALFFPYPFNKI